LAVLQLPAVAATHDSQTERVPLAVAAAVGMVPAAHAVHVMLASVAAVTVHAAVVDAV